MIMKEKSDILLKPLEFAINTALRLDPQAQQKMHQFAGRVISFEVTDGLGVFYLVNDETQFHLSFMSEKPAEVAISGSVFAMIRCFIHKNPTQEFSSGGLTLFGDMDLAEELLSLFSLLEIDWEEQLSKITGDVVAHSVYGTLGQLTRWGKESVKAFFRNGSEYLQEETPVLAPIPAIQAFIKDVDTLRDDVQRLEARIQRLSL